MIQMLALVYRRQVKSMMLMVMALPLLMNQLLVLKWRGIINQRKMSSFRRMRLRMRTIKDHLNGIPLERG